MIIFYKCVIKVARDEKNVEIRYIWEIWEESMDRVMKREEGHYGKRKW